VTVPAERIRRAAAAGAAGDIDLRLAASSDYSPKVAHCLPQGSRRLPSARITKQRMASWTRKSRTQARLRGADAIKKPGDTFISSARAASALHASSVRH
jgi:hypothetical protein